MEVPSVRVAVSYHHDEFEVARQLKRELRAETTPAGSWALVVATERYQPEHLLEALQQCFPGLPMFGGACQGMISHQAISVGGYGVQLIIFPADIDSPIALSAEQLSVDPHGAGMALASQWAGLDSAKCGLLFYDCLGHRGPGQPDFNSAQTLINGLNSRLSNGGYQLAGAGMLASASLANSWLLFGDRLLTDAAMILVLPDELELSCALSHGSLPISRVFEVTAAEGHWLLELDGKPALEVFCDTLGITAGQYHASLVSRMLSIGHRQQPMHENNSEQSLVSRTIAELDGTRGAILLDDSFLYPGDSIQFLCRDTQQIMRSISQELCRLDDESVTGTPLLRLYINCVGRSDVHDIHQHEDAHQVSRHCPELPLAGWYSASEIAPVNGRLQALCWTGVLCQINWRGAVKP